MASYTIKLTTGQTLTTVTPGSEDTSTTNLTLIGQNFAGYGLAINENFVKLLENASSATAPTNPLNGQLWWNRSAAELNVWNGSNWKVISNSQTGTTAPANPVVGDFWFNTQAAQLFVYNGSSMWSLIGPPTAAGTPTTNILSYSAFDGTAYHSVGNVVVNNKLVAVYSTENTSFNPTVPLGGLTTIYPGINLVSGMTLESPQVLATTATISGATSLNTVTASNISTSTLSATGTTTGTLTATGSSTLSAVTTGTLSSGAHTATSVSSGSLTVSGSSGLNTVTATSVGTSSLSATSASVSGLTVTSSTTLSGTATLNGAALATIGGSASFTSINNTPIGASTPSTGAFTTLNATSTLNVGGSSTLGAISSGAITATALTVSGSSSLNSVSAGSISASSLSTSGGINISGTASMAGINAASLSTSGGVSAASLSVSGSSSLAVVSAGSLSVSGTSSASTLTASTVNATGVINVGYSGVAFPENVQIYEDGSGNGPGDFVVRTYNGSYHYSVFYNDGTFSTPGSITTGGQFIGTATSAQYADLAERFASDAVYEPGTVVELGGLAEVTACVADLSENVLGVVSTNPAYLMNHDPKSLDNTKNPAIALAGRVPVKVIGIVKPGDRLVSAGNGLARSGLPSELTVRNVIGRAINGKGDNGVGVVEAIVRVVM